MWLLHFQSGAHARKHLHTERVEVNTGHMMIDQLAPWYFGVAFAFIFTYNSGLPDMPTSARYPRFRRNEDAPRIETSAWVHALSRRIEASVSRDWYFGFVVWKYLFRPSVNLSRSLYVYERKDGQNTEANFTPQSLETKVP